ncbi:MAG TPA: chemotaxis protein CheW [Tenuifilaceae bacterium]|jgi:purine-binding chemotaxis protein CheW|nr:chemotaxis protein CheW [Tenuifilaceae bacterium]HQB77407.1 chemotaxis protein CheW [Tenuifilaceae bacterium]
MNQENLSRINSYLSFKLGEEEFAAHVGKVLNILEMTKITEVPKAPEYMKGVINLRGTVLPVIDTRIKFGMSPTVYTTNTCIIVLDIEMDGESIHVGALVDSVQAVLELDENTLLPAPSIGSKYKSEFIEGVANIDDRFIMILNMDSVFSSDELSSMKVKADETEKTSEIEEIG